MLLSRKFSIILLLVTNINLCAQTTSLFEERQKKFMEQMHDGVALIYATNRQGKLNNNFYYLTGCRDLSKILVLNTAENEKSQTISISNKIEFQSKSLKRELSVLTSRAKELWVSFDDFEKTKDLRNSFSTKNELKNTDYLFYKLREIKDVHEQELIGKAVEITTKSYNFILKNLKPGLTEQDIINAFKQHQKDLGAESTSFIQAGSGINGTQIHAEPTNKVIEDGDLVVFDVGAWYQSYTSDISRTYPANGKFTKSQKEIYELVLKAQKAGIAKMIPGQVMLEVQQEVENVLIDGLYDLGLITDKSSEWQRKLYLVHGYYHYIGLDIHDCYAFMHKEIASKKYEPDMIMTMEPGLYFPPNLLNKKPNSAKDLTDKEFSSFVNATRKNFNRYKNIGIRIEDDILVTKDGNIVLSKEVPKEIEEIEKKMKLDVRR